MIAKSKRPHAERAAENAMMDLCGCRFTRRATRTKFARVDFFACDIIGVMSDGTRMWVQVTAGQTGAVLVRRKKIEAYPWHVTDLIYVWQLVERQDVVNPQRKAWFFRVWEYALTNDGSRKWTDDREPIQIPRDWFKARKDS